MHRIICLYDSNHSVEKSKGRFDLNLHSVRRTSKDPNQTLSFDKLIEINRIFSRENNLSSDPVTFRSRILTDRY